VPVGLIYGGGDQAFEIVESRCRTGDRQSRIFLESRFLLVVSQACEELVRLPRDPGVPEVAESQGDSLPDLTRQTRRADDAEHGCGRIVPVRHPGTRRDDHLRPHRVHLAVGVGGWSASARNRHVDHTMAVQVVRTLDFASPTLVLGELLPRPNSQGHGEHKVCLRDFLDPGQVETDGRDRKAPALRWRADCGEE
jgi:hypothetical protein